MFNNRFVVQNAQVPISLIMASGTTWDCVNSPSGLVGQRFRDQGGYKRLETEWRLQVKEQAARETELNINRENKCYHEAWLGLSLETAILKRI